MSISSADLIAGAIGAVSGVLGAVVGGLMSYWAAQKQHRGASDWRRRNGLRAILIELCQNQPALQLDLDRILPAWLARLHRHGLLGVARVDEILDQARGFRTATYRALFAELVGNEFGSELATYYGRIEWLNSVVPPAGRLDAAAHLSDYVLKLANAILIAEDLVRAIEAECRKLPQRSWGKNLDLEEFHRSSRSRIFAAEVAKFDAATLKRFLDDGEKPHDFPASLAREPDLLRRYLHWAQDELGRL